MKKPTGEGRRGERAHSTTDEWAGLRSTSSAPFLLNPLIDLFSVHPDFERGVDANLDLAGTDVEDGHFDRIVDANILAQLP
jgi:hypothetical protein